MKELMGVMETYKHKDRLIISEVERKTILLK